RDGRRRGVPRDVDEARVTPLDRREVGQDLTAVPAVLVPPLLESLRREPAHHPDHVVAARPERGQQLGLGRGSLVGHRALRWEEAARPPPRPGISRPRPRPRRPSPPPPPP